MKLKAAKKTEKLARTVGVEMEFAGCDREEIRSRMGTMRKDCSPICSGLWKGWSVASDQSIPRVQCECARQGHCVCGRGDDYCNCCGRGEQCPCIDGCECEENEEGAEVRTSIIETMSELRKIVTTVQMVTHEYGGRAAHQDEKQTGLHVHIGASDLTPAEAKHVRNEWHNKGVALFTKLFPSLFPSFREKASLDYFQRTNNSHTKYRGCNLRSLEEYGTIEFRSAYLGTCLEDHCSAENALKGGEIIVQYVLTLLRWVDKQVANLRAKEALQKSQLTIQIREKFSIYLEVDWTKNLEKMYTVRISTSTSTPPRNTLQIILEEEGYY